MEAQANRKWEESIDEARDDQTFLHKLCLQLFRRQEPTKPLRHPDDSVKYKSEDRAEVFAGHLEQEFQNNPATDHKLVEYIES